MVVKHIDSCFIHTPYVEGVADDLPAPPPAGDFANRSEVHQMYCFQLDGISKSPGKPGEMVLHVSEGKIISPNSTCSLTVTLPSLENDQFDYCKKEGMAMLVELTDQDGQLTDDGLPALAGGIHSLRQGHQAKACLTMLFRNNLTTSLVVWDHEIVGWAMLICMGKVDKEWKKEVEMTTPAHLLRQSSQHHHQEPGEAHIKAPSPPEGRCLMPSSISPTPWTSGNTDKIEKGHRLC